MYTFLLKQVQFCQFAHVKHVKLILAFYLIDGSFNKSDQCTPRGSQFFKLLPSKVVPKMIMYLIFQTSCSSSPSKLFLLFHQKTLDVSDVSLLF